MAHGETYEEFVDKFKPQKTTDDCYTPPEVYEAVRQWVGDKVMPLAEGVEIVHPSARAATIRPYPEGCLVLDNRPFSILASIVDWYTAHGIRFFLFAPQLTLFTYCNREEVTGIVCNARVTYANGPRSAPRLSRTATQARPPSSWQAICVSSSKRPTEKHWRRRNRKRVPLLGYPAQVVVASILGKLATRGIEWKAPRCETMFARKLDCGKDCSARASCSLNGWRLNGGRLNGGRLSENAGAPTLGARTGDCRLAVGRMTAARAPRRKNWERKNTRERHRERGEISIFAVSNL